MRDLTGRLTRGGRAWRWRVLDALGGAARRTSGQAVALTFDDGPRPGSTEWVLDLLADLGVPATFFCVGANAVRYPALVRRIHEEGHAVGSHSLTHPDPQVTPLRALAADYAQGRVAVSDALGQQVDLFRPPRGYLDLRRAAQLRRAGLRPWLWNVDPRDWHPDAERGAIAAVAGRAEAGDVVLLHDWVEQPWAPAALDRTETIEALPLVVAAVRRRGLGFTTLEA